MRGGSLWARSVSDVYHFHPPSIGGGTFDRVPWKKRAVGPGKHGRPVPRWSDQWMKCSAQCLAPHRGESHLSGEEVDGKEMASVLHWHVHPAAAKHMVLWT